MDYLLRRIQDDINQLYSKVNAADVQQAGLLERLDRLRLDVDELDKAMSDEYVRKERYQIAEGLIFGEAILLLVGVISAILHFVLGKGTP